MRPGLAAPVAFGAGGSAALEKHQTMNKPEIVHPFPVAEARGRFRHVFVRDMTLACRIGVHRHEKGTEQRVRVNLDLVTAEGKTPHADTLANVVCYEDLVARVRRVAGRGHINLVETLAERIARECLADPRVRSARVRVEKLDVFADVAGVGVEIERFNPVG